MNNILLEYLLLLIFYKIGAIKFALFNNYIILDPELIIDFFIDDKRDFPAEEERIRTMSTIKLNSKDVSIVFLY